ncbi:thioredoxin family protein [Paraliomyxa miuraensis]|uniref:thioredoxin family protein n=1 Tax=Paraliomyxa miuraensis TaxID=376150 RepID=UPI00225BE77C|nr:thioredoxin family protein [Paraliomyxa miuraensis]MCX4241417.1 thioredoxin family protein [Paraliomyxa miuraensis]
MIDRSAARRRFFGLSRASLAASCSWFVVGVVGCGGDQAPPKQEPKTAPAVDEPSEAKASTPPQPTRPPEPGVRPDGEIVSAVAWFHGSLEQALAKATTEGKLVFVDVGAYWCPPCQRLDEEVFVLPEVGRTLGEGYVAVHVDAEKGEGPELVERYRVQAYPTMLVLEATGVEKGRLVDFLPADELLTALRRISEGGNVLAELIDAVETDPDDVAKRYELAHAYLLAAQADAARSELDAVLLADPVDELGLASKALYDRALFLTFKLEGEPERAIEEFRALQRRFPDSKEAVRSRRHEGRILCGLGRAEEAVAALEAMVATNPEDPTLASSYGWFSFREKCGLEPGLAAVRKGIELAPDDADLRYVEAELLHLLDRQQEALTAIQKASAIEPKSAFYRRQVKRFEQAAAGGQPGRAHGGGHGG